MDYALWRAVLAHHIALDGPHARKERPERPGFTFFQAPGETNLIQLGARTNLGTARAAGRGPAGRGTGVAPVEGQERWLTRSLTTAGSSRGSSLYHRRRWQTPPRRCGAGYAEPHRD